MQGFPYSLIDPRYFRYGVGCLAGGPMTGGIEYATLDNRKRQVQSILVACLPRCGGDIVAELAAS